jgi:hypothetical protein
MTSDKHAGHTRVLDVERFETQADTELAAWILMIPSVIQRYTIQARALKQVCKRWRWQIRDKPMWPDIESMTSIHLILIIGRASGSEKLSSTTRVQTLAWSGETDTRGT